MSPKKKKESPQQVQKSKKAESMAIWTFPAAWETIITSETRISNGINKFFQPDPK